MVKMKFLTFLHGLATNRTGLSISQRKKSLAELLVGVVVSSSV
jgi:hypothetical protein